MFRYFIPAFLMTAILPACINFAGDCEKTVVKRVVNPYRQVQAVRLRIDCGATTTPSSTIRIVESSDITDNGNPGNTIVGNAAGTDFYWQGHDTLLIKGVDTLCKDETKTTYILSKTKEQLTIVYQ